MTGCSKISPGCKYCYAERLAVRLQAMGQKNYRNGFDVTLQPQMLEMPLRWKSPRRIFVNSMSDLFHESVPVSYIESVFDTMRSTPQHEYQALTKRSHRLRDIGQYLDWPSNLWMGVSVESSRYTFRIDHLRTVPAAVRFVSAEPLLGPLGPVKLEGIH